jgi:integrase
VLVAALTALRHSELRGLKWSDLDANFEELHVQRSVWKTHIGETKTLSSAARVPVLPIVAKALKLHRKTSHCEFIFAGRTDKPLVLANIVRRDILPALKKAGIEWHGWHGFRRGVATNLYDLGVKDKVIQAILRHADLATTLGIYVKTRDVQAHRAMRKFEKAFGD